MTKNFVTIGRMKTTCCRMVRIARPYPSANGDSFPGDGQSNDDLDQIRTFIFGKLVLCPTIFTESLPLASRGGEKVGDHRPCGERKNRTGGLVDADLGGTGGGLDHPRPVDKREVASVCGSNWFLIFYLKPKTEMVDVPTNPSSRRISSRFVR